MIESEKAIKKKILENFCQTKHGSVLAELREKLGDDVTIKIVDNFSGRLLFIPNKSSLRRATMPMLIIEELRGLEPDSDLFKIKVKNLSEYYKMTQKAIKQMNQKGVYSR